MGGKEQILIHTLLLCALPCVVELENKETNNRTLNHWSRLSIALSLIFFQTDFTNSQLEIGGNAIAKIVPSGWPVLGRAFRQRCF